MRPIPFSPASPRRSAGRHTPQSSPRLPAEPHSRFGAQQPSQQHGKQTCNEAWWCRPTASPFWRSQSQRGGSSSLSAPDAGTTSGAGKARGCEGRRSPVSGPCSQSIGRSRSSARSAKTHSLRPSPVSPVQGERAVQAAQLAGLSRGVNDRSGRPANLSRRAGC